MKELGSIPSQKITEYILQTFLCGGPICSDAVVSSCLCLASCMLGLQIPRVTRHLHLDVPSHVLGKLRE